MKTLNSGVYVVQESGTTYIKIGRAKDTLARVNSLQVGNPRRLILLGHLSPDQEDEYWWHLHYKHCRCEGEWFKLTAEELSTLVDTLCDPSLESLLEAAVSAMTQVTNDPLTGPADYDRPRFPQGNESQVNLLRKDCEAPASL